NDERAPRASKCATTSDTLGPVEGSGIPRGRYDEHHCHYAGCYRVSNVEEEKVIAKEMNTRPAVCGHGADNEQETHLGRAELPVGEAEGPEGIGGEVAFDREEEEGDEKRR